MADRGSKLVRPVSLEQLVSLNDEMAALVRAGIPLETGLTTLGQDMPGRLGRMASFIGGRLGAGESLDQILANNEDRFPPMWLAVVRAGLRSGNLSAALESMSTTGRRVAEMRRAFGLALVYPIIVVIVAFGSFVMLTTILAPSTLNAYEDLSSSADPFLTGLVSIGSNAHWWAISLPTIAIVTGSFCWYRSGRATLPRPKSGSRSRLHFLSPTSSCLRHGRMAAFAETLALLIRQQVPLHEAIELAGAACGDSTVAHSAKALARQIERGETLTAGEENLNSFPPLLGWLIATGGDSDDLAHALSEMAEQYRQRAERATNWATVYLPIIITAVVGGSIVLLQSIAIFLPICKLLYDLGSPL